MKANARILAIGLLNAALLMNAVALAAEDQLNKTPPEQGSDPGGCCDNVTGRGHTLTEAAVTVYWRPGCLYSVALLRSLERAGLRVREVNIWQDEDGAAFVRDFARGNETVPTVRIGPVALINP